MKNGIGKTDLVEWFIKTMNEEFVRKPVTITILDSTLSPVMTWNLENAIPIKWTGPQLKTDTGTVAIQTLDLACGEVTVRME